MELDPDASAVIQAIRSSGRLPYDEMTVADARATYNAGRQATVSEPELVASIREIEIPSSAGPIAARHYIPATSQDDAALPVLIFFHGGGWVLGGLDSHDGLCRRLANSSKVSVLAVDYRLAPEHPYPAAFEDALSAYRWVIRNPDSIGIDPQRIALGGDSAGGNLAAAACIHLRDAGEVLPLYQLLLYPALDFAMDTESQRMFAEGYVLTGSMQRWFQGHYLRGSEDRGDPRISPLKTERLDGLPPAFVLTASHDPLRDEGETFGRRLAEAGVATTILRVPGQIHGFLPMDKVMNVVPSIVQQLGRYLANGVAL